MINGRTSSAAFSPSIGFAFEVDELPCVRLGDAICTRFDPKVVLCNSEANDVQMALGWDSVESEASQHSWIDMVKVEDKCGLSLCASRRQRPVILRPGGSVRL